MIAMAHFAGLAVATIFASVAAAFLDWLFLQAMFHLMRPAGASASRGSLQKVAPTTRTTSTTFGAELVNGTRELSRTFGPAAVRR